MKKNKRLFENGIRYTRIGRRFFLEPPKRVELLEEYPNLRVWLVEYNECYSPKVMRNLRGRGRNPLRVDKARPTSKKRRKLEKAGRKAARRRT